MLNSAGQVVAEATVSTSEEGLATYFASLSRARIAFEVGTHSAWVSELLRSATNCTGVAYREYDSRAATNANAERAVFASCRTE